MTRCLNLGANPNTHVKAGRPFLHYALEKGIFQSDRNSGYLLMLLSQSADVDIARDDGTYTLHHLLADHPDR
jgi:hypothetical protein